MTRRIELPLVILLGCLVMAATEAADNAPKQARRDAIIVRAIERMEGFDFSGNDEVQMAIERHIKRQDTTEYYLELVKKFRPEGVEGKLEKIMLNAANDSHAFEATRLLATNPLGRQRIRAIVRGENKQAAAKVLSLLGSLGNNLSLEVLLDVAEDPELEYDVRAAAVTGLAKNNVGANRLLELAAAKKLPGDTRLLAGGLLSTSPDAAISQRAAELLPLPTLADMQPMAPLDELAKQRGDADQGMNVFRTVGTCSNCHVVGDFGKEVGPNLSEIGDKLSREAMLTSILDPSAGISHNYENYVVITTSGQVITGVKVNETADKIVIRTAEAIDREVSVDDIDDISKSEKSIMPENVHQATGQQGLIDIVEYMLTLKKKS